MPILCDVPERPGELARLLRRAHSAVDDVMAAEIEARGIPGIRPAHYPVLRALAPEGTRMADLARDAGITRQAVAQTVASLAEAGIVEVVPDPSDRRAKLVRYTKRGRRAYAIGLSVFDELERAFAQRVGHEQAVALRAQLDALRETAEQHRERPPREDTGHRRTPPRPA